MTVLVIDDSVDDVCLLQLAARKSSEDISFYSAPDGEVATAYLKGEAQFADRRLYPMPGLILLDLNMPRLDGFAFLDWLREQSGLPHPKVVVWTGSEDQAAMDRAKAAGAT